MIGEQTELSVVSDRMGEVKVSIDPHGIKIFTEADIHPEPNLFKARITQLSDQYDFVRVIADMGVPINILLPHDEVRKKDLHVGDEIHIVCPVDAIQVF
jgi:hypothetical protein